MSVLLEKPKKKATKKTSLLNFSPEVETQETTQEVAVPSKKKTLWDIAEELAKHPLFTIDEKDRDLIYGSNMMTRLLQEEEL